MQLKQDPYRSQRRYRPQSQPQHHSQPQHQSQFEPQPELEPQPQPQPQTQPQYRFPEQQYQHYDYEPDNNSGLGGRVGAVVLVIALIVGTGLGVYVWQNNASQARHEELLAEISDDESGEETSDTEVQSVLGKKSGSEVAYRSHVGDLELVLPESYGVIVRVDGKFGDTERSIFRVGDEIVPGVYRDVLNDYVEVEVTVSDSKIEDEVTGYQNSLKDDNYKPGEVFEADIGDYKGYLVTATADFANLRTYLIKDGNYLYKFTQSTPPEEPDEDNEQFLAVLEGMNIGSSNVQSLN